MRACPSAIRMIECRCRISYAAALSPLPSSACLCQGCRSIEWLIECCLDRNNVLPLSSIHICRPRVAYCSPISQDGMSSHSSPISTALTRGGLQRFVVPSQIQHQVLRLCPIHRRPLQASAIWICSHRPLIGNPGTGRSPYCRSISSACPSSCPGH